MNKIKIVMNCLNINQLALYLTTFGLGGNERSAYDQHLAECKKCREKLNQIKKLVHEQQFENQEACAEIHEEISAYVMGESSNQQTKKLLNHSSECQACDALLSRITTILSVEDVNAQAIPIPEHLAEKIENALEKKLDFTHDIRSAKDKIREIARRSKAVIDEIRLSLTPFEPALGFRGDKEIPKSDFVEVVHNGGDLVMNVGLPSVIVELYSKREKYLDDGESDNEGRVVFADLDSGSYKIKILGHRIDALE